MVLHEKQDLEGLIGTLCDQVRGATSRHWGEHAPCLRPCNRRFMGRPAGGVFGPHLLPPSALFSTNSVTVHIHWLFIKGLLGPTLSRVLRRTQETKEGGCSQSDRRVTLPSAVGVSLWTTLALMGPLCSQVASRESKTLARGSQAQRRNTFPKQLVAPGLPSLPEEAVVLRSGVNSSACVFTLGSCAAHTILYSASPPPNTVLPDQAIIIHVALMPSF